MGVSAHPNHPGVVSRCLLFSDLLLLASLGARLATGQYCVLSTTHTVSHTTQPLHVCPIAGVITRQQRPSGPGERHKSISTT